MKILIIQEASRHKNNFYFRESLCLKRAFEDNGCIAHVYGKGYQNFNKKINFNSYDIIFNLENYSHEWIPDLSKYKNPFKILWSIDAHCTGENVFNNIFNQGRYNLLLHSTLDFVKEPHTVWFPNCFCDKKIKKLNIPKKYNLSFVGNYVNRKEILDSLTNKFGLKQHIFCIGNEMVEKINQTKIHFNKNISIDLNYRNFETIGCGTTLITDWNHMYEKLGFEDMKNVVFYNSIEDLYEKIKFLLENDSISNGIANNGLKLSKKHTYSKRVKQLIKLINEKI